MMHISMIFDPDACICDAGFFRVGRTNERTNKPILGVGCIHDDCIHDACNHDAFFHDACTHDDCNHDA